jgi:hypothetical protein
MIDEPVYRDLKTHCITGMNIDFEDYAVILPKDKCKSFRFETEKDIHSCSTSFYISCSNCKECFNLR